MTQSVSAGPVGAQAGSQLLLLLRMAAREMRGGLRGFYVLIACIALGVMAIAGVGAVASALVEVKAVDDSYPFYGKVLLEPAQPLADILAQRNGAFGAAADPALLARLE